MSVSVRPVHLASGHVQRDARGKTQSGGYQVLDLSPIEVRTLNSVGPIVGPVDFAVFEIDVNASGLAQARDEGLHVGAVGVGPLDRVGRSIGPIDLGIDGGPCRPANRSDHEQTDHRGQTYSKHTDSALAGTSGLCGVRIRFSFSHALHRTTKVRSGLSRSPTAKPPRVGYHQRRHP
jgi:hypothetical protein